MIAVIDIGSNSVRLALWANGKTLYKRIQTTRLSEGLVSSNALSGEAMRRTANAVAQFCAQARSEGAERSFVFATAAVRSAENGEDFCRLVKEACGLTVDVVSGEEEALLAAYGALGADDGAVIDVGGASTEVLRRNGGEITFAQSYRIGAVVLMDACGEDREKLKALIDGRTQGLPALNAKPTYAVGGTATTLAALKLGLEEYDGKRVQGTLLRTAEIGAWAERLFDATLTERRELLKTDAKRADIIAGGVYLLFSVARKTGAAEIVVSDRDNLEGYVFARGLG